MDAPYEAPCSHMACYNCWVSQLANHFCCAACKKPTRRNQLIKRYFV